MATINLRNVPDELHRDAKIEAVKAGMTLTQWVLQAMREKIANHKEAGDARK